jgi:hypothetical protein
MGAPGFAKTTRFNFSTASLLVGPMSSQLTLNDTAHSVGLVKNVMVESSPSVVELTQGRANEPVASWVNNLSLKITAEAYEFTPANLAYALSLNGAGLTTQTAVYALNAAVAAAATTFTVAGDHTTDFTAGAWGYLQEGTGADVHIFQVASSTFASTQTTVTITGYAVPTGMSFTTLNGRAGVFQRIDADPTAANSAISARIIGITQDDSRPLCLHFPKVRILKGFNLRFSADAPSNMPWEITPYTPVPGEAGYQSKFPYRMSIFWL